MEITLSKESRLTLKTIYEIYQDRRKAGQPKSSAIYFSEGIGIEGFDSATGELKKAGFLRLFITGDFELTDSAIVFMENFTKETILRWIEVGSNLIH